MLTLSSAPPSQTGQVRTSYVVDGTRRRFSDEGRPTDTLKIHSATRWLNSDQTALGGIQYVTDGNSGEIWDIRASDGVFFEDINELVLTNGVVIDEHAQEARMTTRGHATVDGPKAGDRASIRLC